MLNIISINRNKPDLIIVNEFVENYDLIKNDIINFKNLSPRDRNIIDLYISNEYKILSFRYYLLTKSEYSFIKDSEFYKSLDQDDIDEDQIQGNIIYCPDNCKDLNFYIKVITFWSINSFHENFYRLILYYKLEK
jgi:hypothetical protein